MSSGNGKGNATAIEQLRTVLSKLDRLDYYEILGVEKSCDEATLKRQFYARSKRYHPDRYAYLNDPTLHTLVTQVYKRIAEAYNVLKDPHTRKLYDRGLAEDRNANLRYDPQAAEKKAKPFDGGTGPGAKYYKLAQQALLSRNVGAARNNIKLALAMEPHNEHFLALKAEIDSKA